MSKAAETADFIKTVRLFREFHEPELLALTGRLREKRLRKGQVLFREGEQGEEMFLVRDGAILVSKAVTGKVEQVLARFGPGDFFGEMSLFDHAPRSATIQAETDTMLLALDRENLNGLIRGEPARGRGVLPWPRPGVHRAPAHLRRAGRRDHPMGSRGDRPRHGRAMSDSAAPRRAKIELLVRREDEQASSSASVGSSAAFVQIAAPCACRPRCSSWPRSPRGSVDQASFILKNRKTERFLLLSEPERFLWDQMDGRNSLQDMATAYVLKYGEFDFEIIPRSCASSSRPSC